MPADDPATDLAAAKAALRKAARRDRAALASGIGAAAATGLVYRFVSTPGLRALMTPDRVFSAYYPMADELDCLPLVRRLAAVGVQTCLPVVVARGEPLVFRRWLPDDPLRNVAFGLSEPLPEAAPVTPSVLLVPMLAFDRAGHRLGYGGGFYDRTLAVLRAAEPATIAIGVAFAGQVRDAVPTGPHDQPLDWIVTEAGVLEVARAGTIG
jgi:5-formyltetrahydrofolate cyclo-ligase